MNTLKETFINTICKFTNDKELANSLWIDIKHYHSDLNRKYHNLNHIFHFLRNYYLIEDKIINKDAFLLAIFYHDIIYDTKRNDNELKSAEFAVKTLEKLKVSKSTVSLVNQLILATKSHTLTNNDDINYFIDCDLAVLGEAPTKYNTYKEAVREEYNAVPDFIFDNARLNVVKLFLKQKSIFKTEYFKNRYERNAILNLKKELATLKRKTCI